ncbi:MAG TPA: hypothetical protein ENJ09_00990 [Planctomycetes bacterium]|nr:hypothetical protein [Planctomycetota bacterium]
MTSHPPLSLRPEVRSELDRTGLRFLAEFLRRACERDGRNVEALAELGHVLTRMGRNEEGLEVDERLCALVPEDPTVHYNLACSLALLGMGTRALEELRRSIELGYDDVDHLLGDDDLATLHGSPEFEELVEILRALH